MPHFNRELRQDVNLIPEKVKMDFNNTISINNNYEVKCQDEFVTVTNPASFNDETWLWDDSFERDTVNMKQWLSDDISTTKDGELDCHHLHINTSSPNKQTVDSRTFTRSKKKPIRSAIHNSEICNSKVVEGCVVDNIPRSLLIFDDIYNELKENVSPSNFKSVNFDLKSLQVRCSIYHVMSCHII